VDYRSGHLVSDTSERANVIVEKTRFLVPISVISAFFPLKYAQNRARKQKIGERASERVKKDSERASERVKKDSERASDF